MKKAKKILWIGGLSAAMLFCAGLSVNATTDTTTALANTPKVGSVEEVGAFEMATGAEIRVGTNDVVTSGIRFRALLNKSAYDTFKGTYANAVAGMVMLPTDTIPEPSALTINSLNTNGVTYKSEEFADLGALRLEEGGEEYYHYSLAIYNLKDLNYARDFSAVGYIRIPDTYFEGVAEDTTTVSLGGETLTATRFESDFYVYTEYLEENARSVYDVACRAYTANDGYRELVTSYMDSVVDLSYSESNGIRLNNAVAEYQAPYSVETDQNGDYKVSKSREKKVKTVLVNGEIQKEYPISYGGSQVYVSQVSENVGIDDTQVQFTTNGLADNGVNTVYNAYNVPHVAFEGKYDVGTYLSVTFTGNNMPYVMFFANNINAKIANPYDSETKTWTNDDTGVLYVNGWLKGEDTTAESTSSMLVFGPNKIDLGLGNGTAWTNSTGVDKNYWSPILMKNLIATNSTKTYTLVIGTEWVSGVLNVVEHLYVHTFLGASKVSGTNVKADMSYICTNTAVVSDGTRDGSIQEGDIQAGNIILYAPFNTPTGTEGTATFSYTAPQKGAFAPTSVEVKGVMPAEDGTVKHDGETWSQSGNTWTNYCCDAYAAGRFTAFMGDYGVGTYVDFEFKGKVLPQVMLFGKVAENDANINNFCTYGDGKNGNTSTKYERQGVVVLNTATQNGAETGTVESGLQIYGPNRIGGRNLTVENGGADPRTGVGALATSEATAFNHYSLDDATNYKYTIGTCLDTDGETVLLDVTLTNLDTGAEVASEKIELTGISKDMSGYICFHAPFVYANGTTLTVKTSVPYTKK